MGEKEDIVGLAMLVGHGINNLNKNTIGDGKYISKGMGNPADFVKGILAQDITPAVHAARMEAIHNMQKNKPEAAPQAAVSPQLAGEATVASSASAPVVGSAVGLGGASSKDFLILMTIMNDILTEVKKITTKMDEKYV